MSESEDLSDIIAFCRAELYRVGETWRSDRTLSYCEKATGKRDPHYLSKEQLEALLVKLKTLPTADNSIRPGARVIAYQSIGIIRKWDEDLDVWLVEMGGKLEPFSEEELELVK